MPTVASRSVTTDGFAPYRSAITTILSDCADFAQLIKVYRATPKGERKDSPAEGAGVEVGPLLGISDPERIMHLNSGAVKPEPQNENPAPHQPRKCVFKKWENHWAVSLWYTFYTFRRVQKSLRVTPAMVASIANHISIFSSKDAPEKGKGSPAGDNSFRFWF